MSKNGLHRHYDRFTPEERFRLDVLAMARGDERESEKLTNTCPKRSYTMNDYAFVRRWETARELAYLVHMDYGRCQDKIQMIRAFRVVFPYLRTVWENDALEAYLDGHHAGSRHAWTIVGAGGEPPGWEPDDDEAENADPSTESELDRWSAKVDSATSKVSDMLDTIELEMAREGVSVWSAFVAFCEEEMGLEAMKLLAALAQPIEQKARALEELAATLEVEPDPASVEEYRGILGQAWHHALAKAS